jgi:uncharacterized OsmC-like protein
MLDVIFIAGEHSISDHGFSTTVAFRIPVFRFPCNAANRFSQNPVSGTFFRETLFSGDSSMNAQQLRELQKPLKEEYSRNPSAAMAALSAFATVNFQDLTCHLKSVNPEVNSTIAGLHPMVGGDGSTVCSAELLLQSLVSCAGVTMAAVACAMGLQIQHASLRAIGDLDFRGTLAVDRSTPTGFKDIRLEFHVESSEPPDSIQKLIELTERYCVVLQTLAHGTPVRTMIRAVPITG